MCVCNSSIRTPYCGVGDCQWPDKKKKGQKAERHAVVVLECKHFDKEKHDEAFIIESKCDLVDKADISLSLCDDCLYILAERSKRPRSWKNIDS